MLMLLLIVESCIGRKGCNRLEGCTVELAVPVKGKISYIYKVIKRTE